MQARGDMRNSWNFDEFCPVYYSGADMRLFLVVFVASTVASIALWQFGLGKIIWPAHPVLASVVIAAACGSAVQLILSRDEVLKPD
jgi:hypothetical protein